MIPPPVEEAMAAGIKAKVTAIEGSHVVMLSQPEAVAKVILEAADSVQ
jgi:pimeloyl-ACP methyl ester carboxylesterase